MSEIIILMNSKTFKKASDFFDEILPNSLKHKSFIYNNIFNNWKQIVGEDISCVTSPSHLKFAKNNFVEATLTINVHEMLATEVELLNNNIIQRINFFFGLNAIKIIKLKKTRDLNLIKK